MAPYFPSGYTDGQKNQRLNEICSRFLDGGEFVGTCDTVDLTSLNDVLTLPTAYQTLERLWAVNYCAVPVRPASFPFARGGIGVATDWGQCFPRIAFDKGDSGGIRQYQLTAGQNDNLTFKGFLKKRYVVVSGANDELVPSTVGALKFGLQALNWEDVGDDTRASIAWEKAFTELRNNLGEYFGDEAMTGFIGVEPAFAPTLTNII